MALKCTKTQTGQIVQQTVGQLHGIALSHRGTWLLGGVRSNQWFPRATHKLH